MNIRKGDKVIVISGKDRGKKGTVSLALPKEEKVVVDGVNVMKKHRRPTRANQKGQIVEVAMPIHVSNVMLQDPKSGNRTRISAKKVDGKYTRIAKKSGATI